MTNGAMIMQKTNQNDFGSRHQDHNAMPMSFFSPVLLGAGVGAGVGFGVGGNSEAIKMQPFKTHIRFWVSRIAHQNPYYRQSG